MRWQDLIVTSRLLTSTPDPNTAPLPDSLRRAVSTAYYAVFHALANSNADCLIGAQTSPLLEHTWHGLGAALTTPRPEETSSKTGTDSRHPCRNS